MKIRNILGIVCAIGAFAGGTAYAETVGSNILYLGDSLSIDAFGRNMVSTLSTHATVAGYAICASGPFTWLNPNGYTSRCGGWKKTSDGQNESSEHSISVPGLTTLLKKHDPDTVILQTGNNMYGMISANGSNVVASAKFMKMKEVMLNGGRTKHCVWITPVYTTAYSMAAQKALATLMEEVGAPECTVYRSLEATQEAFYSGGGHANEHPQNSVSRGWSNMVLRTLNVN